MKNSYALMVLASIALVSCNVGVQKTDDFAKKMDCSEKMEAIKTELAERKIENRDAVGGYTLNELFYSPSMNTCVFSYIYVEKLCGVNYGCTKPEEYDNQVIYVIEDALTGNKIYNERYYQVGDEEVAAFENKIAELKM